MIYRLMSGLLLVCLLISPALKAESYQQRPIIRIGVLSFDDSNKDLYRWQPTIDYLNQRFPQYQFTLVIGDIKSIDQLVASGTIDFVITNGVKFLLYQNDYDAVRMLSLNPPHGDPQFAIGSTLVARSDLADISRWSDIRDKRIIATTPQAFGGFQIVKREWLNSGIDPARDFPYLRFVGIPQDNLLSQLDNGETDIAILPTCVLEESIKSGRFSAERFKVLNIYPQSSLPCLSSTPLYPHWTLSRMKHVHEQLAREIAQALLSIKPDEIPAMQGNYQGWTVPINDRNIVGLMQDIGLSDDHDQIKILWRNYRGWLFIALGYGLLLIGYHLRVSYLVRTRTRQLQQMMELNQATAEWIRQQQEQFYSAQRILLSGEMAAGMAHELNQPLMAINNYVVGCRMRLHQQPLDILALDKALESVIQQTANAKEVIRHVRHFIKKHPEKQQQIVLNKVIDNALALFFSELKHEAITVTIPDVPEITIFADEILIQQVLVNLIRNGLDAIKQQEPAVVSPRLTFEIVQTSSEVTLKIYDNGVGLTKEQIERLFVPFVTSKDSGLGLGMIICKRIIEAHHGRIWAESQPVGACICIALPLAGEITI